MNVAEILRRVEIVKPEINYWFVRTNDGTLFDEFYENNFIAIGWDFLTLSEINTLPEETIRKRIAEKENLDPTTFKGKGAITSILNKIKTFVSLKKGDVIVMPSKNSDRLAFGRISENTPYTADAKSFTKRFNVAWYDIKNINDLNAIFYQVKSNQHTISSIDRFAPYIDRVIGNLFEKNNMTHYVLKIEKEDDISFDDLNNLMTNIKTLIKRINTHFQFDENTDEFFIKVNLQSKGSLELIKSGKSLAILAFLLFSSSCGNLDKEVDRDISSFVKENRTIIEQTTNTIDTLKGNTKELIKPFKNKNGK
ncbi:hypothetical protein ACS126_17945 [Sphingobacterium lactis]|uniref:hypothetical protein n=1 Tax=Sphingobacterium lactis TaxID=797291 RepID=UPI003EC5EED3